MNSKTGKLYMIPCYFDESQDPIQIIPPVVQSAILDCKYFIVEEKRTARRYLRKSGYQGSLDDEVFFELNKHTNKDHLSSFLDRCMQGENAGMISEAGCPGVADPGAEIARIAHKRNIQVVPLPGPSSILMALMASGMNGQQFCFNGYIPVDKTERIKKIREMERTSREHRRSEIFMDTPFRNNHLFEDILQTCSASTLLCVACDITLPSELIITRSIESWKRIPMDIHKRLAIFILFA